MEFSQLPADILFQILMFSCSTAVDVVRIDYAMMNSVIRANFLAALKVGKLTVIPNDIVRNNMYNEHLCIPWLIRRGMCLKRFTLIDDEYFVTYTQNDLKFLLNSTVLETVDSFKITLFQSDILTEVFRCIAKCKYLKELRVYNDPFGSFASQSDILSSISSTSPLEQLFICRSIPSAISFDNCCLLVEILRKCHYLRDLELDLCELHPVHHSLPLIAPITSLVKFRFKQDPLTADHLAFNDEHIRLIADIAPNLHTLILNGRFHVSEAALEYVAEKCPHVHTLGFPLGAGAEQVLRRFFTCGALRRVQGVRPTPALLALLKEFPDRLETIVLHGALIRRSIIVPMLRICTNLERVAIVSGGFHSEGDIAPATPLSLNLFSLATGGGIFIADIYTLSLSFPALTELKMSSKSKEFGGAEIITPHVLLSIFSRCPMLQYVELRFETLDEWTEETTLDEMAAEFARVHNTRIEKLSLYASTIPSLFVKHLLNRCPRLQHLILPWNASVDNGYIIDSIMVNELKLIELALLNVVIYNFDCALVEDLLHNLPKLALLDFSKSSHPTFMDAIARDSLHANCQAIKVPQGKLFLF